MKNVCAFCSGEMRKRAVEIGKFSTVILSNPRLTPGHILIIPKRHVQIFSDLENGEVLEIFKFLAKYQDKVLNTLSKGTEIRQNYRPFKKDSDTHVNHFHFHILPRDEDDELAKKVDIHRKPFYKNLTEEENKKITKLLK